MPGLCQVRRPAAAEGDLHHDNRQGRKSRHTHTTTVICIIMTTGRRRRHGAPSWSSEAKAEHTMPPARPPTVLG